LKILTDRRVNAFLPGARNGRTLNQGIDAATILIGADLYPCNRHTRARRRDT